MWWIDIRLKHSNNNGIQLKEINAIVGMMIFDHFYSFGDVRRGEATDDDELSEMTKTGSGDESVVMSINSTCADELWDVLTGGVGGIGETKEEPLGCESLGSRFVHVMVQIHSRL